ncbi:ubiquitin carboxyl-terminal hydrolase [Nephila pilipes]|uniref:Ubiquitin carboxyl-terminal hydrolase n=1 Tax=Nephila pilipes TaxID=299642 RepID=A0A8X6TEK9_NEPPI|nr:ubiquitin carboxyl-terminal hydrolase [Nephila pilipes]
MLDHVKQKQFFSLLKFKNFCHTVVLKMARAEINQSLFASSHSNLPHLNGPLPPKRSRLSLRRTTQFLNKPCYKEDDNYESKHELLSQGTEDKSNVEMIDLTQDENASPNCISSLESKPATSVDNVEESDIKVWTLGLPNCGNTCFINSILQVLRYTPDFLNSLHSLLLVHHQLSKLLAKEDETKELSFFRQLHLLYSAMKRKEALMRINADKDYSNLLLKPVKLVISSLREVSLLFEEGEQHDAHELLITTINAFHTACHSLKKHFKNGENVCGGKEASSTIDMETGPSTICDAFTGQDVKKQIPTLKRRKTKNVLLDSSVIENLSLGFEGKILYVIQCLECEKRLAREENFTNLELNIPETVSCEDTVDLRECLSQTTILSGENKYFCEDCQHHNEARMSSEVVKLPPILLLHFNWSRNSQEANAEKSRIKLIIPRSFGTSENSEVFCCSPEENYKLFAVVLHIGRSTEGGHYVSFIKDASQDSVQSDNDQKHLRPKFRQTSQFSVEPVNCCTTEEISNFKTIDATTRWLLFDDNVVSPVCIDEDSETFPYFNYLSITASPCMIFYHKT